MRILTPKQNRPQARASTHIIEDKSVRPATTSLAEVIMHWQRTLGNQAVQRLVQTQSGDLKTRSITPQRHKGGCDTPAVQRDGQQPAIAAPRPEFITSSAEPLPGDPVPGYERFRVVYTERDRQAFKKALGEWERRNLENAGAFLGDYGSALLDLWARYATEAIAEVADESSWSLLSKMFAFVIKESLLMLAGFGVARAGQAIAEVLKLAMAGFAEVGLVTAENDTAASKVQVTRAEIDAKTRRLADQLRQLNVDVVKQLGGGLDYAFWLAEADLTELSRFRLPPTFPRYPTQAVRAAVAQVIVGLLHGPSPFVFKTTYGPYGTLRLAKNVISMSLKITPDQGLAVSGRPFLNSSEILTKELSGRPIKDMPNIPLYIEIDSVDTPDMIRATLNETTMLSFPSTLEAFLRAYPSKSPTVIKRDASGHISVLGGGLLAHLYLYRQTHPHENLASLVHQYEAQHQARQKTLPDRTELLAPETLAGQVYGHLLYWDRAGAMALISSEKIGSLPLQAPLRQGSGRKR
jgi:hypothetical protein